MTLIEWLQKSDPVSYGTLMLAFIALVVGLREYRRNKKNDKKLEAFEELTNKINTAKKQVIDLMSETTNIITIYADVANQSLTRIGRKPTDNDFEDGKKQIEKIYEKRKEHIQSIHEAFLSLNEIISTIEENTLISDKSRNAAKHLRIEATNQQDIMWSLSSVMISMNVNPTPGNQPDITPDTFKKIGELVNLLNARNGLLAFYLDDLKVVLHNDLARKVFPKAKQRDKYPEQRHITEDGIIFGKIVKK